jgi:hypothetical protein
MSSIFPAVTDNDQYDFVLTGDGVVNNFDGIDQQPSTFTIYQYLEITVTFGVNSNNPQLTISPDVVYTYTPNKELDQNDSNYNFQAVFTITSSAAISVSSNPLTTDWPNLTAANNGGTNIQLSSSTGQLTNNNLTYTITVSGTTSKTGIQNVLSEIDIDTFIGTNFTPEANELTHTVIEDTPKSLTLSAFDADGDSLIYTIISGPSNGKFYVSNGGAEITSYPQILTGNTVWYKPNNNYFGPDSFTIQVYDGKSYSNIATNAITVTPVNDLPIIDHDPWTEGTYSTFPNPVNTHVFEEGDAFTATATATDVEDPATDLTWSIISEFEATGSGETTTPSWITETTNSDGSFTITADEGGIRAGNVTFYIKVVDTDGGFDTQIVKLGGIVPTVNSYFKFFFDASSSMNDTLIRLQRDLLGVGVADPYNDSTCLQYYLQDFYATGLTESQEDAQQLPNNTATNGSDEYDSKVTITSFQGERIYNMLNNNGAGFGTGSGDQFPNASSVVIGVFSDESQNVYYWNNEGGTSVSALCTTDVDNLAATIEDLNNVNGPGFYRGIYFSVDDGGGYGSAQDDMWNASITGTNWAADHNLLNVTSNLTGQIGSGQGQIPIIADGDPTPGYYTEQVVNQLRALNYNIPAYGSPR